MKIRKSTPRDLELAYEKSGARAEAGQPDKKEQAGTRRSGGQRV